MSSTIFNALSKALFALYISMPEQSKTSVSLKIWFDDDAGMWAARVRTPRGTCTEYGGTFEEVWLNIEYAIHDDWCESEARSESEVEDE